MPLISQVVQCCTYGTVECRASIGASTWFRHLTSPVLGLANAVTNTYRGANADGVDGSLYLGALRVALPSRQCLFPRCYVPEFAAEAIHGWLQRVGVKPIRIFPGSPWENGHCESFNARFRDEFLNGEIFYTTPCAKPKS